MLSAIEEIKQLREKNAQAEVLRERAEFARCEQELKNAEQSLKDYSEWRVGEERRKYQSILGSKVDLKGLEKVKHEIGVLRQKEVTLEDQINQARKERNRAERDLYRAELALNEARKALEKCHAIATEAAKEHLANVMRKEDNEMEEVSEALFMNTQRLAGHA